jgi:WD40 repeat protein
VFAVDMLPQVGLLSGGEDGQVLYYRYGQWSKPKRWKGHVRSVHSVSLHPSGKIGLTVARDKSLKLWKTNGECVTSLELGEEAFTVQWIQDGSSWLIATQNSFSVHSLQNGLVQEWKYPTRLVCICALSDSIFVVGGMDGYVRVSRWLWVWVCVCSLKRDQVVQNWGKQTHSNVSSGRRLFCQRRGSRKTGVYLFSHFQRCDTSKH